MEKTQVMVYFSMFADEFPLEMLLQNSWASSQQKVLKMVTL